MMGYRRKLLIIWWLGFSWFLLIIFTLKPLGVINILKQIGKSIVRQFSVPQRVILCDFEKSSDFTDWYWRDTFIEASTDYASTGRYSAKITYYAKTQIPSLILENYNLGPKGERDWSYFKFFNFLAINPYESDLPLHLKIKDIASRSIDKVFELKRGENRINVDLEEVGQFIDLTNVVYLNFYLINPSGDVVIYLDDIQLERADLKSKRILDKPVINFIKISCPKQVKKRTSFPISFLLSTSKELKYNYRLFIHISHIDEIKKKPSQRRYYINADQDPQPPTSEWKVNSSYEIGPLDIFIPQDFPTGEYLIQVGLFNPYSRGSYQRGSGYSGMLDFHTSFPRLRYTNPEIKNYVVEKIKVLD